MIRSIISLAFFVVALVILQLVAINLAGGVGGSLGVRPVSPAHTCVGLTINGATTSALPSGDWGFSYLLHVRYYVPEEREGVQMCLGQDVWMEE